ncbi:hypothetical protein GCM10017788_42570 [Amycolatopsis acidiphila]|nr:hypothetical protein GCM10017788_42570 [Amycolatopsis acidiphila]
MAETSTCQVRRIWLGSGRDDVLIGELPGFADNISTGGSLEASAIAVTAVG